MSLLVFVIVVLVLVALGVWGLSKMPLQAPVSWLLPVLVIALGMVGIAWKAGLIA